MASSSSTAAPPANAAALQGNSSRLAGKSAVVTGAASGIGLGAVKAILLAGARGVTMVDKSAGALDGAFQALQSAICADADDGGELLRSRVHSVVADVSKSADVERSTKEAAQRWGGTLDILFLNAGIMVGFKPLEEYTEEEYDRIMDVNAKGVWLGIKSASPYLKTGSSVIITSSVGGLKSHPLNGAYAMSKWAVRGFARTMARDWASRGIRVNSIHPGGIETPLMDNAGRDERSVAIAATPVGRLGTSEEIGNLVVFLGSDESSFMTGSEIAIDGGMVA